MAPIDQIRTLITDAIVDALKDREAELTAIAEAGGSKAGSGLFGDVSSLVGIIGDVVGAVPIVGELVGLPLEPLKLVEGAAGKEGEAFGLGWVLGNLGYQALQPLLEPLNHAVAKLVQTGLFDPQTAAGLVSKGIMPLADASSEAAGGNLDGHHFNMLIDAAGNRPGFDVAAEMLRRGLIQQADFATALARNDVPSFWWDAYQGLTRILLSPADLALANLRGEIPLADAVAYAGQLGLLETDFNTLVANTGEPPGTELLMEALRRGFIQEDTFARGIRQSRVRDEWIDTLLKVRYTPMSTADAVRAVVEHYLPESEGAAIAQQNGLEAEHWPILVESWGRPLAHEQMMSLYYRGLASKDEVTQAFRESDLKDKYTELSFELGRRLVPERQIVQMLQHDVIPTDVAFTMLHQQGYNDDDIASLINLGTAQQASHHKTLTKADIVAMYTDAIMNRRDALDNLGQLGIDAKDAGEVLDLADFKRKAAVLKAKQGGIEASLKAHHITEDQALQRLYDAGIDHDQARALVDEWLQQRKVQVRNLTEKQIIDAAFAKIITVEDAHVRLAGQGLSDGDATIVLKLAGLVPV
jgi:hypothetical protein